MLGAPGMGKTLFTRRLVDAWATSFRQEHPGFFKGNPNRRLPIFIADPNRGFPAPYGEFPAGGNEDPSLLYPWIRGITGNGEGPPVSKRVGMEGGLIVLDDADVYLENTNGINPWRPLWTKNRHLRLDVIVTAHRPQGVPKEMIAAAKMMYLFAMEEPNAVTWLQKIPCLQGLDMELPDEPFYALKLALRPREEPRIVKLFNKPGGKAAGRR